MKPVPFLGCIAGLCLALGGCKAKPSAKSDEPPSQGVVASASASARVVEKEPMLNPEEVKKMVNPAGEAPHSGPAGTVRGVVRVRGDASPAVADVLSKIPRGRCDAARSMYGKKFREGPGRTLADAVVGVIGYKGYVPAKSDKVVVNARGCAYEHRTVAMTFGQRLEVSNRDGETYIPQLLGSKTTALMVAMPGGDPVKLVPSRVGEYVLIDKTHEHVFAQVFVMKYATHAVTGLDGKFEIDRVPAGEVQVSAYSPTIGQAAQQKVTVPAGGAVDVVLEIQFEAANDAAAPK